MLDERDWFDLPAICTSIHLTIVEKNTAFDVVFLGFRYCCALEIKLFFLNIRDLDPLIDNIIFDLLVILPVIMPIHICTSRPCPSG